MRSAYDVIQRYEGKEFTEQEKQEIQNRSAKVLEEISGRVKAANRPKTQEEFLQFMTDNINEICESAADK